MSSLASLAIAVALLAAADERTVCVPAVDGGGWECGKGDQAPAARSLPRTQPLTPSTPPPYLMDPSSMPSVSIETAPIAAPAPEPPAPAAVPEPALIPEPAPIPEPKPAPVPTPEPRPDPVPLPEPAPEPIPEPDPAPMPVAVADPEPAAVPAAAPTPAPNPESAPPVAAPSVAATPVARVVSSVARDAADLLALPGTGYTVQLAAARGLQGFTTFRQKLGIAVEDTFVIRVRRGNEDWWLMLWRDFPDLAGARSAAATLSAHGVFWPRRLAPLQSEVRATPN